MPCGRKRSYRRERHDRLIAGIKRAAAVRARATVEARVGRTYGELSVREIALFNLARKEGYRQGYAVGYGQRRRAARRQADDQLVRKDPAA